MQHEPLRQRDTTITFRLSFLQTHRGLGVHLSFVRSITMDAWKSWKPEKLMQMQKGGNGNALAFFQAKNVPGGTKDQIRARYNHIGAWMYREKLEASVEGRAFSEAVCDTPHPSFWMLR